MPPLSSSRPALHGYHFLPFSQLAAPVSAHEMEGTKKRVTRASSKRRPKSIIQVSLPPFPPPQVIQGPGLPACGFRRCIFLSHVRWRAELPRPAICPACCIIHVPSFTGIGEKKTHGRPTEAGEHANRYCEFYPTYMCACLA